MTQSLKSCHFCHQLAPQATDTTKPRIKWAGERIFLSARALQPSPSMGHSWVPAERGACRAAAPCPVALPLGTQTHTMCWQGAWAESGIGSLSGRACRKGHLPARQPKSYRCLSSFLGIHLCSYSTLFWLFHKPSHYFSPWIWQNKRHNLSITKFRRNVS